MGMTDELMFERDERKRNEVLASYLMLPLEVVESFDVEIQMSETSDGAPIAYYFEIPAHVPEAVISGIDGANGRTIYLPLSIFDEGDAL
jgi:hypothetical protein